MFQTTVSPWHAANPSNGAARGPSPHWRTHQEDARPRASGPETGSTKGPTALKIGFFRFGCLFDGKRVRNQWILSGQTQADSKAIRVSLQVTLSHLALRMDGWPHMIGEGPTSIIKSSRNGWLFSVRFPVRSQWLAHVRSNSWVQWESSTLTARGGGPSPLHRSYLEHDPSWWGDKKPKPLKHVIFHSYPLGI